MSQNDAPRPTLVVTDPVMRQTVVADAYVIAAEVRSDEPLRALASAVVRRFVARSGQTLAPPVPEPQDDDMFTRQEAARALRCSERTLRRRVAAGQLPAVRDGRLVRFRRQDLATYIEERISR